MIETFDIVNAQDNLIGKAKRDECHEKGLLHRGVHVLVFDGLGKVLVRQRSHKKDVYPDFWEASISGHVNSGEVYKEAALRALREKLAIAIAPKQLKQVIKFGLHTEEERQFVMLYVLLDYKGDWTFDKDETKIANWWTIEKLQEEVKKAKKFFTPSFLHVFKSYNGLSRISKDFLELRK